MIAGKGNPVLKTGEKVNLEDLTYKLLRAMGIIHPEFGMIREVQTCLSLVALEAANEAKQEERNRCYEFAMYCRNRFLKHKDELDHDIVLASEVIAEGIQKGSKVFDGTDL